MTYQECLASIPDNLHLEKTTVKCKGKEYYVLNVIVIPPAPGIYIFAEDYFRKNNKDAINKFITRNDLELGLDCVSVEEKNDSLLRILDVE